MPEKGAGVTGDAAKAAVEQFPDGLAYRKDLPAHLAGPDGFAPTGQLRGTHNLGNATKALDAKGATYSLEPTDTPGISELKYKYKDPVTGKTVSGRKTVYDPKVISDQTMLDDALKAGEQGWGKYCRTPHTKSLMSPKEALTSAYTSIPTATETPTSAMCTPSSEGLK